MTEEQLKALLSSLVETQVAVERKIGELHQARERNTGAIAILKYILGDTSAIQFAGSSTQESAPEKDE